MKNYYESLGVAATASEAEIKHAYRQLALRLHPDRTPDPAAQALFLEVQEAYDVLGDRHRRLAYELLRQRARELAQQPRAASPYDAPTAPIPAAVARRRRQRAEAAAQLRLYAPRARRFNWLMIALCFSLALDWALPLSHYPQEVVMSKEVIFVSVSRANPRIAYVIRTPNTHFKLRDEIGGLLHEGDRVAVWRTPIWRFVQRIQANGWPVIAPYASIYTLALALWPAVLLGVSAVGLLWRRSDELQINTAVVAGLLLPIVAYMMYSSW